MAHVSMAKGVPRRLRPREAARGGAAGRHHVTAFGNRDTARGGTGIGPIGKDQDRQMDIDAPGHKRAKKPWRDKGQQRANVGRVHNVTGRQTTGSAPPGTARRPRSCRGSPRRPPASRAQLRRHHPQGSCAAISFEAPKSFNLPKSFKSSCRRARLPALAKPLAHPAPLPYR